METGDGSGLLCLIISYGGLVGANSEGRYNK